MSAASDRHAARLAFQRVSVLIEYLRAFGQPGDSLRCMHIVPFCAPGKDSRLLLYE
jgi:hypothetical protein